MLDHFASMVGTDSYRAGLISESAGTVLSLSVLLDHWEFDPALRVSYHRGIRDDEIVLFDCCESGAVCLDWFVGTMRPDSGIDALDRSLSTSRIRPTAPIFLPQMTGVNPPEFLPTARGAFVDLSLGTDVLDLAYAVMEGVAHLLRSNIEYCESTVGSITQMVSTGGGTASPFWTQLKADVCRVEISVPRAREATCRGAAVLGLVGAGVLGDLSDAAELSPVRTDRFSPERTVGHEQRYPSYQHAPQRLYG